MTLSTPTIGGWYQDRDGELFEVVALDADDQTIEVQYFDGTLQELEKSDWLVMSPEAAEAPEDWTGSMDIEPEDHEEDMEPDNTASWAGASHLDRDEISGYSEWPVVRH